MSMDIRSYFGGGAKKATPISPAKKSTSSSKVLKTPKNTKAAKKSVKKSPSSEMKRKAFEISSDEDVVKETPEEKPKHKKTVDKLPKKRRIVDSDDDAEEVKEKSTKSKMNLSKLKDAKPPARKAVDMAKVFGTEPVKRVDRKTTIAVAATKSSDVVKMEFDEDDDFDKSILDINTEVSKSKEKTPLKENKNNAQPKSAQKKVPEKKSIVKVEKTKSPIKSPVKQEEDDYNTSIITDEDRHDKKRMSAILYQHYKNRAGPANLGSKEIPKGKPNCLSGLSFVVTGVLDSMEREEACDLIKEYGGKVISGVTKKLNFMVVGEEAGPRKLEKAEELKIKQLNEDDLLNLIREKSGIKIKPNKLSTSVEVKKEQTPIVKVKQEISSPKKSLSPEKKRKVETNGNRESSKKIKKESPVKDIKIERPPSVPVDAAMLAWVDKYKPTTVNQIIGQQGAASPCAKLLNWLKKWYSNHDGKKKLQRPSPWAKNDDGAFFKAALLSGPPGVGKTTTANLVSKELGLDVVEFNASDTRSKRLLKEQVSELLSTKSLYGYFHGAENGVTKQHVLLMDEVDGMAGNEDRGGMQELIALIKDSSVPIICMCNDRNHPKIRSLVNYCFDLRFNKPRIEQIKGAMMTICFKENLKLGAAQLEEVIQATNNDIRQTLNHLSLLNAGGSIKPSDNKDKSKAPPTTKDLKFGPWDVVRKVFSIEEHKTMSFADKSDLFFQDYSLGPLFVQQNYLSVAPKVPKAEVIKRVALTADSLSMGDLVEKKIRTNNAWSLLPTQATFSSVLPGEYMEGNFTGQINFPGWLGKNSRFNKRCRLAQEIQDHTRVKTSGSRLSVRLDYAPFLLAAILRPLKEHGTDGVEESLNIIKEYRLLREDIDSLIELTSWPGKKSPMDAIDSKVKAALTRAYNKEVGPYTYSVTAAVKKKKVVSEESEMYGDEDEDLANNASDDEQENDNMDNDVLIKAKKKPAAAPTKGETSKRGTGNKAGTSKAKGKK